MGERRPSPPTILSSMLDGHGLQLGDERWRLISFRPMRFELSQQLFDFHFCLGIRLMARELPCIIGLFPTTGDLLMEVSLVIGTNGFLIAEAALCHQISKPPSS